MKKMVFLVAGLVFLMVGMAQAGSFVLPSQTATNVTIADPGAGGATSAALFNVIFEGQNYQAFCTDYATINWNTTYNDFSMITLPSSLPYKQAAYIYENYSYNGPVAQLAVWEVVFEGLSGGTVATVTGGPKFSVTGLGGFTTADLAMADTYVLAAIAGTANGYDTSAYRLLVSPSSPAGAATGYYGLPIQDFITKVPEPATMLLLGLGLVGLAGIRRFKK